MHRCCAALAVVILALGCGDDTSSVDAGEDTTTDVGSLDDLDEFLESNGVVTLELQDDGNETGNAMTRSDGRALFYSPLHSMFFDLSAEDGEMGMPLMGRSITVSVGESAMAYLVEDPSGVNAPLLHTEPLSDESRMVMVDAYEQAVANGAISEFDPEVDPDPFESAAVEIGSQSQALFGGLATLTIRTLLTSLAVSAAASVLGNLARGACNFVAPLYTERCQLFGSIVSTIAGLVGGAKFGGGSLISWDLAAAAVETTLSALDLTCDKAGAALVGYVIDPQDDRALGRYQEVARKFNYLLHVMETDPKPGQPSWEDTREQLLRLVQIRDVVRNAFFHIWNADRVADAKAYGFGLGLAKTATTEYFNSLERTTRETVLTRLEITEVVRAYLEIGEYDTTFEFEHYLYQRADFSTFEYTESYSGLGKAINGLFIGCAIDLVSSAVLSKIDMGIRNELTANTFQLVDGMLEVFERGVEETFRAHWGGDIPMGECTPDLYEPNGTWELAVADLVPVDLVSGGVTNIEELTLCDLSGMSGNEEDWYAFEISAVEFETGALLVPVSGGDGQTERVCLDIFFYSEIYEIGGSPPDLIRTECGPAGSWTATDPFSIRRTIGERWSMLLIRVRPEDPTMIEPVQYHLRFTP